MTIYNDDTAFLASLDDAQRSYYLQRSAEARIRLQETLTHLSRGFGLVSALHGEATVAQLASHDQERRQGRPSVKAKRRPVPGGASR